MESGAVGIVVVSHSGLLATGLCELARQVAGDVPLVACGGGPTGDLGTDPDRIAGAVAEADGGSGVVVLADLGSAVLSVRAVIASGDVDPSRTRLADAPLVEGTVAAAVVASTGASLEETALAAEEAWDVRKL